LRPASLQPSWLLAGVAVLLLSGLIAIAVGPVNLGLRPVLTEVLDALPFVETSSGLSDSHSAILWQLRIPRVVLGALVGALLASCGAAYQGVFRNPLVDPYLLGAAAGAGLGITLAVAYGASGASGLLPIAAFAGALMGVMAAYILGRSGSGGRTTTSLVLAGVAVTSFLTAVQTYFQQREDDTLREVYTWILGRLATAGWKEVLLILPYAAVSTVVLLLHRRLLDVVSVGDEEADSVGVSSARVRLLVVAAASLGTAAAVAVSGLIGFVGIIVPHTVRLVSGSSYRVVMPLSLLLGAAFLILTDLIARTIVSPAEVPIGVVTAFFGAPFFMIVLRKSRRAA
jgi:iron complex transport system permease protein